MNFVVSADRIVKGYPDLARELKKLWNMKATVIPIVIGALEIVPKNLEKRFGEQEIRGRMETTYYKNWLEYLLSLRLQKRKNTTTSARDVRKKNVTSA